MEPNNNFYKHLGIEYSTTNNDIINAYEYKMSAYYNKDELSEDEIQDIKMLKIALYILTNQQLRFKYNKLLNLKSDSEINKQDTVLSSNELNDSAFEIINNELSNDTLDSLFNIDNSWMNNINNNINKKDVQNRKNKEEFNIISDRVFSLSEYNRPSLSSDFEEKLRQPHQGRVEKNSNNF